MNEKPTAPKGCEVMAGKDLPSPVPDKTRWWNPIRLKWMPFQPIKDQGQSPHSDLWHAIPTT